MGKTIHPVCIIHIYGVLYYYKGGVYTHCIPQQEQLQQHLAACLLQANVSGAHHDAFGGAGSLATIMQELACFGRHIECLLVVDSGCSNDTHALNVVGI